MTSPDTEPPTLAEQLTLNIKAEIIRKGLVFTDIKDGIGLSHGAAMRRSSGAQRWRFAELTQIAEWLGVERDSLLPGGALTWDLVVALEK